MEHLTVNCNCSNKENINIGIGSYWSDFMMCNIENVVVFKDNNFFLLTIPDCAKKYKSMSDFLLNILEKSKENDVYRFYKSINIDNDFREHRTNGVKFKKFLTEVNYIYHNSALKKYSIVTKKKYLDYILSQEERDLNYSKAIDFLKLNPQFEKLKESVTELYNENFYHVSEIELIRNTDELIKQINKKI